MIRNTKKNGAGKPAPQSKSTKAKPAGAGLSPLEAFLFTCNELPSDGFTHDGPADDLTNKDETPETLARAFEQWRIANEARDRKPAPNQLAAKPATASGATSASPSSPQSLISPTSPVAIDSTEETAKKRQLARMGSAITHAKKQIRIKGDSMRQLGIKDGDMVDIELNAQPKDGDIVCADVVGVGRVVRTLKIIGGAYILVASNPAFEAIPVLEESDMRILGVVARPPNSIH